MISHDTDLLEATVNKVFHLDANRAAIDIYNMGWKRYLQQRETDERARKRERANAEKKAAVLMDQANKMRAKATKAVAAQNMAKRAERLLGGLEEVRAAATRWRRCASRTRALRQDPADRRRPEQVLRLAGDLHRRRPGHRPGLPGGHPGPERRRQDHPAADAGRRGQPDTGEVLPGPRPEDRLLRPGTRHAGHDADRAGEHALRGPGPAATPRCATILGSFLFSGDDVDKPAGVLSGGEKTRLALATIVVSSANVLLLDEPTNNLDPASRAEILGALRNYTGAVVMVSHDEGAVQALNPERVVLLPDGVEDLWNEDYLDLVTLA